MVVGFISKAPTEAINTFTIDGVNYRAGSYPHWIAFGGTVEEDRSFPLSPPLCLKVRFRISYSPFWDYAWPDWNLILVSKGVSSHPFFFIWKERMPLLKRMNSCRFNEKCFGFCSHLQRLQLNIVKNVIIYGQPDAATHILGYNILDFAPRKITMNWVRISHFPSGV